MKRKILTILVVLIIITSVLPLSSCSHSNEEYQIILTNIFNDLTNGAMPISQDDLEEIIDLYSEDGYFTDIDYEDASRAIWPPRIHLIRLETLAFQYVLPSSENYGEERLNLIINKGLEYWCDTKPESANGWHQAIGSAKRLGEILILMRFGDRRIDSNIEKKVIAHLKKTGESPLFSAGANKTDIALHWMYRAVLERKRITLRFAVRQAYSTIKITTRLGIQADYSYLIHGKQLYNYGYGEVFVDGVTKFALATTNTSYALPPKKLDILSNFVMNGMIPGLRGNYKLYNLTGRGVARPGNIDRTDFKDLLARMATIDPKNATIYNEAIARISGEAAVDYNINPQTINFNNADYLLHQMKGYTFDVRGVSNRTVRCEHGNGENLKGYFMSDGGYSILVRGDEYFDIFPLWNWSMIPGTTAPHLTEVPRANEWGSEGDASFVGGLAAETTGVFTYSYYDSFAGINTGANKGYFVFDDIIICLGNNINSSNSNTVYTTLNQTLARGDTVFLDSNGEAHNITNKSLLQDASFVFNDNIAYFILDDSQVYASRETRTSSWNHINSNISDVTNTDDVFTAYIDHGSKPSGATYAYAILPNKTIENAKEFDLDKYQIVANTQAIQAVKNNKTNELSIIFYDEGEIIIDGIRVSVDRACIVLLKDNKVYISDPTQKLRRINVNIQSNDLNIVRRVRLNRTKGYRGSTSIID